MAFKFKSISNVAVIEYISKRTFLAMFKKPMSVSQYFALAIQHANRLKQMRATCVCVRVANAYKERD